MASTSNHSRSWQRRWAGRLIVSVLVVAGAAMAGFAIFMAGPFLVVTSRPEPADVIVVTYGVMGRRGLTTAARLYESGLAPKIVLSRFRTHPDLLTPEPIVYALRYLVELGVPADAAAPVPRAVTSLVEEARQLAALAVQRHWSHLLVVATDYRSRRTEGTIARALQVSGARATILAVREPQWDPAAWWQTRQGIDHVWNEYPRLVYYRLRGNL